MQTVHDIFEIAGTFAADLTQTQKTALFRLCQAAQSELQAELRPQISVQDCYESFTCAAAYLALSRFYAAGCEDVGAFEVGNLKITRQAAEKRAAQLRQTAQQMMAPFARDDGFSLRGVRV